MKIPEEVQIESTHDHGMEDGGVSISPQLRPAGLIGLRQPPRGVNELASRDKVPQHQSLAVPTPVLDACSIAARHMGHSSIKILGVTSCRRGEGRSTIAAGLAMTHAYEYQHRTVLVDLDLERPSVAQLLGLGVDRGVSELLREESLLAACIHEVDQNLAILTAGSAAASARRLLGEGAPQLLQDLEATFDVVVVDLPPLAPGSGAAYLADLCDTITMVIRSGRVERTEVADGVGCLAGPVYAIVNDVKPKTPTLLRRMLGLPA